MLKYGWGGINENLSNYKPDPIFAFFDSMVFNLGIIFYEL
jgi:hypothetical protein